MKIQMSVSCKIESEDKKSFLLIKKYGVKRVHKMFIFKNKC